MWEVELLKAFYEDDRQPSKEAARLVEAQWLESGDPRVLLDFLRDKINDRQLNRFAIACCRRAWTVLNRAFQAAVETTELYLDGLASKEQQEEAMRGANCAAAGCLPVVNRLTAVAAAVTDGMPLSPLIGPFTDNPDLGMVNDRGVMAMVRNIAFAITGQASDPGEFALQCNLLRDIVGNPFRPITLDPSWHTSTVVSLSEAIYGDRAFDRMPILADALEEAGCTNQDILQHCRGGGEHVRGCWVVDMILGKS